LENSTKKATQHTLNRFLLLPNGCEAIIRFVSIVPLDLSLKNMVVIKNGNPISIVDPMLTLNYINAFEIN
jgi:hypothetical protein